MSTSSSRRCVHFAETPRDKAWTSVKSHATKAKHASAATRNVPSTSTTSEGAPTAASATAATSATSAATATPAATRCYASKSFSPFINDSNDVNRHRDEQSNGAIFSSFVQSSNVAFCCCKSRPNPSILRAVLERWLVERVAHAARSKYLNEQ